MEDKAVKLIKPHSCHRLRLLKIIPSAHKKLRHNRILSEGQKLVADGSSARRTQGKRLHETLKGQKIRFCASNESDKLADVGTEGKYVVCNSEKKQLLIYFSEQMNESAGTGDIAFSFVWKQRRRLVA